jgi:Cys-tRNA(Pro) deacylase
MKEDIPVTTGVRFLRDHGVAFVPRLYAWVEHGGTANAAAAFGMDGHAVVKTIVMRADEGKPFLVLMHGDREVSTKALARVLGARKVELCDEGTAHRHTGYQFGGTGPFGTRVAMPVYAEKTIFDLPRILINAGKRGFLAEIDPLEIRRVLAPVEIEVGIEA